MMIRVEGVIKLSLLLLAFIFSPLASLAAQTLTVATGEYSPTIGSKLKHGGYTTHMLTLAFENQGIQVDIQFMPWKRALIGTKNQNFDLSFYWYCSKDRQLDFYCGEAIWESEIYFFHLKSFAFDWQDYDDLTPYFIGLTASYHYSDELTQLVRAGKVRTHETTKDIDNVKTLLAKRIDIFPMTALEGQYLINKSLPTALANKITYHPKALLKTTGHPLFPKANKDSLKWMGIYNQGIKNIREQGILDIYRQKLIEGWYEQ